MSFESYRPHAADRILAGLRSELMVLRARYDDGAVSPAIYSVIRQLETDVAWLERRHETERDGRR
jgi:hypothetical protein